MSQEENIKEKEKIIIQAARRRFAHYGFSKVTMDEIAGDVEMGKASLYYYFPTKEELFKSVISLEQNEFVKNIEALLRKKISATEKLNKYVEQRLKYFQVLLNLGTLSVHSYFDFKSVFRRLFEDFEEQELLLLNKIINEGKQSGEFSAGLPEDTTKVFLHILQGLRLRVIRLFKEQRINEESYKSLESEMITATEFFINGIQCREKKTSN